MEALRDLDIAVFRFIHVACHSAFLDPVFWVITSTGLGYVQAPPVLLFLRSQHHRRLTAPLLLTFALTGLSNLAFKQIVPRERPSNLSFSVPQEGFFYDSFPSGHSVTSFGMAFTLFFLTRHTPQRNWGRWAIVWACLVGLSRVYRGVHWPSDVLGAACVGLFWASLLQLLRNRTNRL